MIALLALLAQLPEARVFEVAPTLEVAILSKHAPARIDLVSGRCVTSEPGGHVTSVSARPFVVRVCVGKTCSDRPQVELSCEDELVLRIAGLKPRTYGRGLRVTSRAGRLRVIAKVELEDYVSGVVVSELADAPIEARRAQAVLARSFAVRAAHDPRHDDAPLCDLTHCQVFAGVRGERVARPDTDDVVLVDSEGHIADVFFHSTCGGMTASPRSVWGDRGSPEVVGIQDLDESGRAWCRRSPHFRWVHEVEASRLLEALSPVLSRPFEAGSLVLSPTVPDSTRWQVSDREGTEMVRGEVLHLQLARALGFSAVKSSLFLVARAGDVLRLSGSGLGHRVGLCQSGAIARAKAGASAREILRAYFPKLDVAKVVAK